MLSAYAALRERPLSPTENARDVEIETDSEEDIASTTAEASVKRRPSPKTVLPSRKRRKGNQDSRYFAETVMKASNEASYVPTRSYSPSDPISTHDIDMLETVHHQSSDIVSTFSPSLNQNVFFSDTGNSVKLYTLLRPSETLSFAGTVAITVLQGSISLFGSVIPASPTRHSIYAPKNYPLATVECITHSNPSSMYSAIPDFMKNSVTASDALLMIEDLCSGVQGLRQVCASHVAIFETPNDSGFEFRLREFFPVRYGDASRIPFITPPSWSSALVQVEVSEGCTAAIVKGPKGSGKSMFGRMLVNRLLSRHKQVAYLDCDPGQTEFTPPGMVSLHILTEQIYGPPFTHPIQPFKAHFVGSTTIQSSPDHYQACVQSLLDVYRLDVKYNYEFSNGQVSTNAASDTDSTEGIPLVINSFGWSKGLGAEAIQFIESQIDLTDVYTFESARTDSTWSTEVDQRMQSINLVFLEPIRRPKPDHGHADRRSLMTMSYFHHIKGAGEPTRWNTDVPLCGQPPWEVAWVDAIDRIILIGNGSEDVVASEVLRALNGGIVALVEMEPSAPGILQENESANIVPYTQGSNPPPPNRSNCVGMALVRGVRASTGMLHIITPVRPEILAQARVLVMGEVKLPIWGMLDFRAEARSSDRIAGVRFASVPFLHWTGGPDGAAGAKKLRVRRNLMRKNQSAPHL